MDDDFFKPPSFSVWMLGLVCSAVFALGILGDTVIWPVVAIVGLGGAVAGGAISRWAGRCIGWLLRDIARGAREGWIEGREKAQRERAERQMRGRS